MQAKGAKKGQGLEVSPLSLWLLCERAAAPPSNRLAPRAVNGYNGSGVGLILNLVIPAKASTH